MSDAWRPAVGEDGEEFDLEDVTRDELWAMVCDARRERDETAAEVVEWRLASGVIPEIDALREQVATLTRERDEARAEVERLRKDASEDRLDRLYRNRNVLLDAEDGRVLSQSGREWLDEVEAEIAVIQKSRAEFERDRQFRALDALTARVKVATDGEAGEP